jgi:quinol monooxygenase YgiN
VVSERDTTTSKQKTDSKGVNVHVQIVNFHLKDISEEDYRGLTEAIAPAFADLPGLVSKTWLADPETNTYGGVYVWQDRQAMENYKETDIYKGMSTNPHLDGVTVKDFAVLENPTRTTRGLGEAA